MAIQIGLPAGFRSEHATALGQIIDILPDAAEITIDTQKLVVVEYQVWKDLIKARQGDEQ